MNKRNPRCKPKVYMNICKCIIHSRGFAWLWLLYSVLPYSKYNEEILNEFKVIVIIMKAISFLVQTNMHALALAETINSTMFKQNEKFVATGNICHFLILIGNTFQSFLCIFPRLQVLAQARTHTHTIKMGTIYCVLRWPNRYTAIFVFRKKCLNSEYGGSIIQCLPHGIGSITRAFIRS